MTGRCAGWWSGWRLTRRSTPPVESNVVPIAEARRDEIAVQFQQYQPGPRNN
jgi:hypothetical protein